MQRKGRNKFQINDYFLILVLAAAVFIAAIVCIILLNINITKTIRLTGGSTAYYVDDQQFELKGEPFVCEGTTYIPAEDILQQCGYVMGWSNEKSAVVASTKKTETYIYIDSNIMEIDGQNYTFNVPTRMYKDVLYMPMDMYLQMSKNELFVEGTMKEVKIPVRDLMQDTQITDEYRIEGDIEKYNGVYLVDGKTAMEMLAYSKENSVLYAGVINAINEALPEVKVYNLAIPSITEFYGPQKLYTDQISGIRTIYENLNSDIMPVNAVREMWAHADEKLYFDSDHHWTQRGAYYAYKAFIEATGEEAPDLSVFPKNDYDNFKGSWVRAMSGTRGGDLLGSNPEVLERFMPVVEHSGVIYSDMNMTSRAGKSKVINENNNTYSTFIYGDQPLTHYTTNVKNGKKLMVIKESFGDAFATWTINNYEEVFIVDPRYWNGMGGHYNEFNLQKFYSEVAAFDDLLVISYPGSTTSSMRQAILALIQ